MIKDFIQLLKAVKIRLVAGLTSFIAGFSRVARLCLNFKGFFYLHFIK